MATKTIVLLIDDFDGGEADHSVTFSLDGVAYEIDLSHANIDRLAQALQPFMDKARKTKTMRNTSNRKGDVDPAQVRAWARDQGISISDRGRVPAEVLESYRQRP